MSPQDWVTLLHNAEVPDEAGNNHSDDDDDSSPSGIDELYDILVRDEVAMMQHQTISAVDQGNDEMETSITESQREEKRALKKERLAMSGLKLSIFDWYKHNHNHSVWILHLGQK